MGDNGLKSALFILITAFFLTFPLEPLANISGSPHDFSTSTGPQTQSTAIAPTGICSGCHIPHGAGSETASGESADSNPKRLWKRSLDTESTELGQNNNPNYVGGVTLLCYDCHSANSLDNLPDIGEYATTHRPPDIAFGIEEVGSKGDGLWNPDNDPNGTETGFYETNPPTASNHGVDPTLSDPARQTGGHFYKSGSPDLGNVEQYDKIACNVCHDPHNGDNQAFIRADLLPYNVGLNPGYDGEVTNGDASPNMSNPSAAGESRSALNSREYCVACHGTSDNPSGATYKNLSQSWTSVAIVNPPVGINEHDASSGAACTDCHHHNSVGMDCTKCHGDPVTGQIWPDGDFTNNPGQTPAINYADDSAGGHDNHVQAIGMHLGYGDYTVDGMYTSAQQADICRFCHPNPGSGGHDTNNGGTQVDTGTDLASRVDLYLDTDDDGTQNAADVFRRFNGDLTSSKDVDGTIDNQDYQYAAVSGGTCNNLVCHNQVATPDWNSAPDLWAGASGSCSTTTCHDPGTTYTNCHNTHLNTMGYACIECHEDHSAKTYPLQHQNGKVNMVFSNPGTMEGGTAGGGDGYYDKADGNDDVTGDAVLDGIDKQYDNPADSVFMYKSYQAGGWNFKDCREMYCHGNEGIDDPPLASRVDGQIWSQGAPGMPPESPTGGNVPTCIDCHATASDTDDYTYNNGIMAMVQNAGEWDTTGHGTAGAGAYDSGNDGAAFADCSTNCHTSSVAHGTATNPFRLTTKGGSPITDFSDAADPQDDNTVCLDCHSASGQSSGSATKHVEENHFGTKHSGIEDAGGSFCWDCHDPHGDADDYMIHTGDTSGNPGEGVTDKSDGIYGIPASSRQVTNLDVVNGGYTSDDLANAGNTGLCQTCHDRPGVADPASYFTRNLFTQLTNHNGADTTRCTVCHKHTDDFAPTGCNGCHGFSGDSTGMPGTNVPEGDNSTYHDDANNPLGTRGGGVNTPHRIHVDYLEIKRSINRADTCYVCHAGGGSQESGGHPGNQTNNSFKSGPPPDPSYVQIALDKTGAVLNVWNNQSFFEDYKGDVGQAAGTGGRWKTCNNTTCHYGESPSWAGVAQTPAVPGVTISPTSVNVTENGPTDTYDVVLDTLPTGDVVVTVTSADTATGVTVDKSSLTFNTGNWSSPQTVTVTAVDDATVEGAHTATINHNIDVGLTQDSDYDALADTLVGVTANITDNDAPGVSITESGGSTDVTESGVTDTYTVVLNTQPTADVDIEVTPTLPLNPQIDLGAGPGNAITLTFTGGGGGNWSTPQTVTVTAVNDSDIEGPHTSTITHATISTDTNYSGITTSPDDDVTVNITDNDTWGPGVTITESGGSTDVTESGVTDTYTVVLDWPPTLGASVDITVTPDAQTDLGAGAGAAITLTFYEYDWGTPQTVTVTAVDDAAAEGAHTSTITHYTDSATDVNYQNIPISYVTANIADNDSLTAGVTFLGVPDVTETGLTDTYQVVLDSQPSGGFVFITVTSQDTTTGVTVDVGTLTFPNLQWDQPQTVTVTAVDDAVAEGSHTVEIMHDIDTGQTTAPEYVALQGFLDSVWANITDNDLPPGVTITESGGSTDVDEGGATDTYTVVLNTEPTDDVYVTVTPDGQTDLGAGPGTAITLTFTGGFLGNWGTPRTVTVWAVDDSLVEGFHASTITHTSSSNDPSYAEGLPISDVTVNITDNDTAAGVTITESGGSTDVAEGGATDTYTAVLNSQPTADVVITATPDAQTDLGAGGGTAITLTFTGGGGGNWSSPQTVTVTAVDDAVDEASPHTSTIIHSSASADTNYNGIGITWVTANITDNDTAGVTITETGGSTDVNEEGATTDTYDVVLDTLPTGDVVVTVTSADTATGVTVDKSSLTFNTGNWSSPQTVTVTAVDDATVEGAHTATINHNIDVGLTQDADYDALADTLSSVTANITDNDVVSGPLVTNGKFINDLNGWTNSGATWNGTSRDTDAGSGSAYATASGRNATASFTISQDLQQTIPADATGIQFGMWLAKQYTVGFSTKPGDHDFTIELLDATSAVVGTCTATNSDNPTTSITWVSLVGNCTNPGTIATQVRVSATTKGDNNAGEAVYAWVDEAYVIHDGYTQQFAPPRDTGTGGFGIACNTCHQFGPDDATAGYKDNNQYYYATAGDHGKHGMLNVGADPVNPVPGDAGPCETCHGTGVAGYGYDHMDGTKDLAASGNINGGTWNSGPRTCSDVSCHGGPGSTTPEWGVGTTACIDCHVGGNQPTSGLHQYNATYPDVEGHDDNFGGASNYGCTDCHQSPPSDAHANGTLNNPSTATFYFNSTGKTINLGVLADNTDNTCTASCHADNNSWQRQWSASAYSAATTPGDPRCSVCHGQLNDWRGGLTVNHNRAKVNDGTHSTCAQCHVAPNAPYAWGTHHDTTPTHQIQYNSNADLNYDTAAGTCNSACHDNSASYVMGVSTLFAESGLSGSGASCTTCHGADSGPESGRIWPDNNAGNNPSPTYADNDVGAHDNHVLAIGQYLGYGNDPGTYTQGQQVTICAFCHPSPGGTGHSTDDGTDLGGGGRVNVFNTTDGGVFTRYATGAQATEPDAGSGTGTYDYTLLSCSNVDCHNETQTPNGANNWGTPPTLVAAIDCQVCHPASSYTNRHGTHVTDNGYACTECHTDHETGLAFQHQSGAVDLVWTNVGSFEQAFGGSDGAYSQAAPLPYKDATWGTCGSAACHNNKATPTWDAGATASCTVCHTPGDGANVNPTSGIHDVVPTVSGVQHDDNYTYNGGASTADCTTCHGTDPTTLGGHRDGTDDSSRGVADALDPRVNLVAGVGFTDAATPTCGPSIAGCHAEQSVGESWSRKWHDNAALSDGSECAGCHGDWTRGWNTGVTHRVDANPQSVHGSGTSYECKDCHALEAATGYDFTEPGTDWGAPSEHGNGVITLNSNGTSFARGTGPDTGLSGCSGCHNAFDGTTTPNHSFTTTSWTLETVSGDAVAASCDSCHGDGAGQYWPDGSGGNPGYVDDNLNSAARHDAHVEAVSQYKWGEDLATLKTDNVNGTSNTKQKTVCGFCHPNPGGSGHNTDSGDQRVDVHAAASFRKFTGGGTDDVDTGSVAYDSANRSCQNLSCHNLVTTPTAAADNWEGATGPNCTTLCHTPNNTTPAREGHEEHAVTQGFNCTECHTDHATVPNYRHITGVVDMVFTNIGSMEQTYGSATVASYSEGTPNTFRDGLYGTCSNVYCHNDKDTPAWNGTITANGCTACHTPGGTGGYIDPTSGLHNLTAVGTTAHDDAFDDGTPPPTYDCTSCHQTTPTNAHRDGTVNNPSTATFNWDTTTYLWTPSLNALDNDTDNTCVSSCHSDGGDWARKWSLDADSDHTNTTPAQAYCGVCHGEIGSFNTGVEHVSNPPHECDTCHFITTSPQHRDGNIDLNNNLDAACSTLTDIRIATGGGNPGVWCNGCHANDASHTSPRTDTNYWTHDERSATDVCISGGHPGASCLSCHEDPQGTRRDIGFIDGDYSLISHHIQGASTQAEQERGCQVCHYEMEEAAGGNDDVIKLKAYSSTGTILDDASGNPGGPGTTWNFDLIDYIPGTSDESVITPFCLGCHGEYMKGKQPFALSGAGDTNTPVAKSWDGNSIESKYTNTGTIPFGKFNSANLNVVPKDLITKAYSPHGNIDGNEGGYTLTTDWSNRRTGSATRNVHCMDCHNSHGSAVAFTWWQTPSSPFVVTGGNPRTEPVGVAVTYDYEPTASGSVYSENADFCWDCHLDDDQGNLPAGFRKLSDFGTYSQEVGMYRENISSSSGGIPGRWVSSNNYVGSIDVASNRSFVSDHFQMHAASMQHSPPNPFTAANVRDMGCSACHDPHGVSDQQQATIMEYMVPALKGTWVTSPYKEDRPPRSDYSQPDFNSGQNVVNFLTGRPYDPDVSFPAPRGNPDFAPYNQYPETASFNVPEITGGGMGTTGGSDGYNGYFIDENTFGYTGLNYTNDPPVTPRRMGDENSTIATNGPAIFAGLCMVCHPDTSLQGTAVTSWDGVTAKHGGGNTQTYPHQTVFGDSTWNDITVDIMSDTITGGGQTNVANPRNKNHAMGQKEGTWSNYRDDGGPFGPEGQDWKTDPGPRPGGDWDAGWDPNFGHAYRWGAKTSGIQANYHQFPCSKCHTPHVSSLPRLMVTNCLDNFGTNHTDIAKDQLVGNTTAGQGGAAFGYAEPTSKQDPTPVKYPEDKTIIGRNNACHSTNRGTGWNEVTPW